METIETTFAPDGVRCGCCDPVTDYPITIRATFEESGQSWREMYEEVQEAYHFLNGAYGQMTTLANEWREKYEACGGPPLPVVNSDEVGVKPHKRHRPRKRKVCCVKCGLPLTEDGFCTYCQGSESLAQLGGDSEGQEIPQDAIRPDESPEQDPRIADVFKRLDDSLGDSLSDPRD